MAAPREVRSWARMTLVLAAMLGLGCGAGQSSPSGATAGDARLPSTTGDALAPPLKQLLPAECRIQSPKLLDRRARSALAPDTLSSVRSVTRVAPELKQPYRRAAPSTVIVRTPVGLGSGVIVDAAGWVLTNHHVVAGGRHADFEVQVEVLLGEYDATKERMRLRDPVLLADVYRADPLRDLALLKLRKPPANLSTIALAQNAAVTGQAVIALGHGGAGWLWTAEAGEIRALPPLDEHLASLVRFDETPAERLASERFRGHLAKQQLGTVIESSCTLLSGAGGGPLVNGSGELVGLNVYSELDEKTGARSNYHLGLPQIRAFIEPWPTERARLIPDPWEQGGGDASYEDADRDGRIDIMKLRGRRPCSSCPRQSIALFVDVDQDSFGNTVDVPSQTDVYESRSFDAEVVFLRLQERAMVWYDTDNDGDFDVLLLDEGTTGQTSHAYRIRPGGKLTPWPSLASGRSIRLSLFQSALLRDRLNAVAGAAFPSDFVEANTAWQGSLPDPLGKNGDATLADLSLDGKPDSIRIDSAFGERTVVDVDQNWVGLLPDRVPFATQLAVTTPDPELSVVSQGAAVWIWYDTDDDGRLDLVLHAPGLRLYVATEAWELGASGELQPRPEHVGRKLLRADLFRRAGLADGLRTMIAKRGFLPIMSAKRDVKGQTFPHPVKDHRGNYYQRVPVRGGAEVVSISGTGSEGLLVDLDPEKPIEADALASVVKGGSFLAELAYFHRGGLTWVFYDTDQTAGYDVVLFSAHPEEGKAEQAFRVSADGTVSLDRGLAGRPLISPSLFTLARQARRIEPIAKELFSGSWVGR